MEHLGRSERESRAEIPNRGLNEDTNREREEHIAFSGHRAYIGHAMSMKLDGKMLITGASGFVGSHLRDRLLGMDADVLAIRRPGSPPAKKGRSVEARYEDLAALSRIMRDEKPDYVFHVAGATKGRTYRDFSDGNVLPTQQLLRALEEAEHQPKRFVHISSLAAWGPSAVGRPVCEDDPARPVEFYGRAKLEAERVIEAHPDIPSAIIRPAGVFGPRDVDYLNLFESAQRGLDVYFGNERRYQSVVYIDDLIDSILAAAGIERAIGRAYFIANPEAVTWGEFQGLIVKNTPRRVFKLRLPEQIVDVAGVLGELATRVDGKPRLFNRQKAAMAAQEAWICSVDRAREELGFETRVPLEDAVALTAEWYRRERWI